MNKPSITMVGCWLPHDRQSRGECKSEFTAADRRTEKTKQPKITDEVLETIATRPARKARLGS